MENFLIEVKGISKYFYGVPALTSIDFELKKGEVHALMGENGAGKSTLSKIITGIYQADEGKVFVEGKEVRFTNTREALEHGVAIVTQEFSLLPDFSVAENIFLTDNRYYKKGFISNKRAMADETRKLLQLFNMESFINPYDRLDSLSVAQMQIIEILKAVSTHAKAIILDEPTASLSAKEIQQLFALIRKLKSEGVGFVIVSHKINEIYEISDRITVLRDGKLILKGIPTEQLKPRELIKAMVGREINDLYGVEYGKKDRKELEQQEVILEVRGMTDINNYVRDISFSVRKGEIAGFSGLIGAGRSELFRCIYGADRRKKGQVFIRGKEIKPNSIKDSIANNLGFVPEDRKNDGLIQDMDIKNNTCLTKLAASHKIILREKQDEKDCYSTLEKLQVKYSDIFVPIKNLSGGNQQKVLLGKWFLLNPDVLIIDEPTRGVDIGARQDIYAILKSMASQGMAIIVISSEIPEILGICDTVYVMREGRITAVLDASQTNEEEIGYYLTIG